MTEVVNLTSRNDIDDMIVRAFGLTQHLAGQSRDESGDPCCCVCGTSFELVSVGRGWGGVFACRSCALQTEPR